MASGIMAVHNAGIIHRDIKPENVLIDSSTSPSTPKIADFGIASICDSTSATRTAAGAGTPLVHGAGSQRRIQVLPRHGCLLAGNRAVRDGLWGHPVQRTLQLRHRSPRSNRPHTSHRNSRLTLGSPQHDAGQESGCAPPDRRGETESGSPRTRTHGNPRSARPGILPLHTRDVGRSRDSQPAGQSSESGERRNPRRIASGHLAAPVERRARIPRAPRVSRVSRTPRASRTPRTSRDHGEPRSGIAIQAPGYGDSDRRGDGVHSGARRRHRSLRLHPAVRPRKPRHHGERSR